MALWTDLAEWRGPTPNRTKGGMNRYDGQVTHIAAGFYEGTISWQLNDSSNVSSHFVVGREWGQCAQLVDTVDAAWTQGEGNGEWISVENAGFLPGSTGYRPGWEFLSPWQIECNAQLYARGHKEFGWPLQLTAHPNTKGLGYHGMGAENGYRWGHIACPGEAIKSQLPEVLARAIAIVNGDDDMALEGIDKAQVNNSEHYLQALVGMTDVASNISNVSQHDLKVANKLTSSIKDIQAKVTGLSVPILAPVDPAALKAVLLAPEVLAAIAKAVNDDGHNRSAA